MPILSSVSVDVLNFEFNKNTNEFNVSPSSNPLGTPKIDNKYRNTTIQKQISLYEKDLSMEHKNLANEVPKFIETPSNLKLARRRIGTVEAPTLISAEDLEKSMTNIEKNLCVALSSTKDKCSKTKSCVNLKSIVIPPSNAPGIASQIAAPSPPPGSVLVRESFIEPPKRVAKSFHGKTQFSNLESVRRSSDSPHQLPQQAGPSKITNLNQLHRQYSNPIPGGSSLSISGNNITPSTSTHRFKTTIVKEDNIQSTSAGAQQSNVIGSSSNFNSSNTEEMSGNDNTLDRNIKTENNKK